MIITTVAQSADTGSIFGMPLLDAVAAPRASHGTPPPSRPSRVHRHMGAGADRSRSHFHQALAQSAPSRPSNDETTVGWSWLQNRYAVAEVTPGGPATTLTAIAVEAVASA